MKIALKNDDEVSLQEFLLSSCSTHVSYFAPNLHEEASHLLAAAISSVTSEEQTFALRTEGEFLVAEGAIAGVIEDCLDLLCAYAYIASFPEGLVRKIVDTYRRNTVIGFGGIHNRLP